MVISRTSAIRASILAGAGLALAVALQSCVVTEERPPLAGAVRAADIPEPTGTDLRDFTGDSRDKFLSALDDLRHGKTQRARKMLGSLEREVRDSPVLRAAAATADLMDGAIEAPRETLQREATRSDESIFVLLCYALAAQAASDFDEAYRAVEAAAVLSRKMRPAATEDLEARGRVLRKDAAASHMAKGRELARDEDVAGALLEAEAANRATPDDFEVMAELGDLHMRAGNFAQGDDYLSQALQASPGDGVLRKKVAEAHLKAGKFEDAKRTFAELLSADPQDRSLRDGFERAKAEIRRQNLPARFRDLRNMPQVTRSELAALLFETVPVLRDLPAVSRGVVVTDVAGSWAKDYILMAVSQGLMEAYEDHTFGAEERVSRADLADALARSVKRLESRPGALVPHDSYPAGRIEDLPRGHGRFDSIVIAIGYDLMELEADHTFRPADAATGREAVVAVERLAALVTGSK